MKQTLVQNLTFMALIAAINVIAALLTMFEPFLSIFVMLVLPLVSAFVGLFCRGRYLPIYLVAASLVSFFATLSAVENTLFYIIPAIITGTSFGWLIKKQLPAAFTIIITAGLQLLITFFGLIVIEYVFEQDFVLLFTKVLAIENKPHIGLIVPSMLLMLSLIQTVISYSIITNQLPKIRVFTNETIPVYLGFFALISAIITCISALFFAEAAYLSLMILIYFSLFAIAERIINKSFLVLYFFGGFVLLMMILTALLIPYLSSAYIPLLIGLPFVGASVAALSQNYLRAGR